MTLLPKWAAAYRELVACERVHFGLGGAFIVLAALAEGVSLALLGFAATRDEPARELLLWLSAAIALVFAASAGLKALGERSLALAQIAIERRMRAEISSAILNSDWQDFVDQPGHELQSAVLAEAPQVAGAVTTFVRGFSTLISAGVVFAATFLVSIPAAFVCAGFAVVIGWLYTRSTRELGLAQEQLASGTASITRHTAILIAGLRTLRLSPIQEAWQKDLDRAFDAQAAARLMDVTIPLKARLRVELAGAAMIGSVLGVQTWATGDMLAGLVVMAMMLRVLPRLQAAQQALASARHGRVWLDRWESRLAAVGQHPLPTAKLILSNQYEGPLLELEDVSFSYRGHSSPVIDHVNWSIHRGEWVSLVGPSGGGKSTLIDLIGGILRPTSGSIRVLGRDATQIDQDALHARVAIVPQDIHLLGTSVESVLTWGDRLARPASFDRVCRQLGVTEMFLHSQADLTSGLDELARDISGGMRTRLAIARALMSEPSVLVLDETTSRLHPEAEAAIFDDVRRSMPQLAVVVVTHRLETAQAVGKTLRLQNGTLTSAANGQI